MRWWIVASTLLLAGCVQPNFTAEDVPLDAPNEGGYGQGSWTIDVVDKEGAPVAGAAVAAAWPVRSTRVCAVALTPHGCETAVLHVVALRTNAQGRVTVHAPTGYTLTVVAAFPGLLQQWEIGLVPDGSGETAVVIPLPPPRLHLRLDGVWMDEDINEECQAHRLVLHPDEDTNRRWLSQLVDGQAILHWTNEPLASADLQLMAWKTGVGSLVDACPEPTAGPTLVPLGPQQSLLTFDDVQVDEDYLQSGVIGPVRRSSQAGVAVPFTIELDLSLANAIQPRGEFEYLNATLEPAHDLGDDPMGLHGPATKGPSKGTPGLAWSAVVLVLLAAVAARR